MQILILSQWHPPEPAPTSHTMACGCPVAASNQASIPEVVGDAAVLFDPEDVDQIAESILFILSSEARRKDFIRKGLNRVKGYTREATALKTLQVYRSCYQQS